MIQRDQQSKLILSPPPPPPPPHTHSRPPPLPVSRLISYLFSILIFLWIFSRHSVHFQPNWTHATLMAEVADTHRHTESMLFWPVSAHRANIFHTAYQTALPHKSIKSKLLRQLLLNSLIVYLYALSVFLCLCLCFFFFFLSLSLCFSLCLSVCLCLCFSRSLCLCLLLSFCLSICLSVCLSLAVSFFPQYICGGLFTIQSV